MSDDNDKPEVADSSTKIFFILFYGSSSAAIVFFNKIVLSVYNFKYVMLLMCCQICGTIVLLWLWKLLGWINLPPLSWSTLKKVAPLTLFQTIDVVAGIAALRLVNIPMYVALRKLSFVLALVFEYFFLHMVPTSATLLAIFTSAVGSIISSIGDLAFEPVGYAFAMLTNCTTAMYRIIIKRMHIQKDFDSFGLMYVNNVLSLPFIIVGAYLLGDFNEVIEFPYLWDAYFQLTFVVSCGLAFMLNYSNFRCTAVTSPLVTSVTGMTKNLLVVFIGLIAFHVPFHVLNVSGHVINAIGTVMFFFAQFNVFSRVREKEPSMDLELGSTKKN